MSLETLLVEAMQSAGPFKTQPAANRKYAAAILATPAGQQIRAVYEAAMVSELNSAEDESALAAAADEAGAYR